MASLKILLAPMAYMGNRVIMTLVEPLLHKHEATARRQDD